MVLIGAARTAPSRSPIIPNLFMNNRPPSTFSAPVLTLVIAVYNKPEILRLVLAACVRQSFSAYEIIVADDGSGKAIREVVEEAKKAWALPITHLWHEDRGWRKNTMLNNAIRASTTGYLVFIDGDCLPSRDFLRDHWAEREAGKVLLGRRVETSQRWADALTPEMVSSGAFEKYHWADWMDGLRGDALRLEDGIRLPSRMLRKMLLRNVRGMLGSNFSVGQDALEKINGFDELYNGPGCGEDSDPQFRLGLIGVTGKPLRNLAIQYHIHHRLTSVSDECWDRFEKVKTLHAARCRNGLVREE